MGTCPSEFALKIRDKKDSKNVRADDLFRLSIAQEKEGVLYPQMTLSGMNSCLPWLYLVSLVCGSSELLGLWNCTFKL